MGTGQWPAAEPPHLLPEEEKITRKDAKDSETEIIYGNKSGFIVEIPGHKTPQHNVS